MTDEAKLVISMWGLGMAILISIVIRYVVNDIKKFRRTKRIENASKSGTLMVLLMEVIRDGERHCFASEKKIEFRKKGIPLKIKTNGYSVAVSLESFSDIKIQKNNGIYTFDFPHIPGSDAEMYETILIELHTKVIEYYQNVYGDHSKHLRKLNEIIQHKYPQFSTPYKMYEINSGPIAIKYIRFEQGERFRVQLKKNVLWDCMRHEEENHPFKNEEIQTKHLNNEEQKTLNKLVESIKQLVETNKTKSDDTLARIKKLEVLQRKAQEQELYDRSTSLQEAYIDLHEQTKINKKEEIKSLLTGVEENIQLKESTEKVRL